MRRRTFDALLSAAGLLLVAVIAAYAAAGLMLILSVFGFVHLRRTTSDTEILPRLAAHAQPAGP